MHFYPPEINSTRMYSGPGAGSLLAAAGSWDAVSAELSSTAEGCESAVSGLDLHWRGLAAEAMSATAARYTGWLQSTAEHAKQTAMAARTAAAAYEHAHAMTVPPSAVAANRLRLSYLVATNIVGQNTAAIAQTDAQYAEYWAQDATAMSGYDTAAKAATTQLSTFSSPNNGTDQSGLTAQHAAVTNAANSAAASNPVQQVLSGISNLAGILPTNASILPEDLTVLDGIAAVGTAINSTYYLEALPAGVIGAENNLGILPNLGAAAAAAAAPAEIAPALSAVSTGGAAGLGNVTATLARAGTIGPMSVPVGWSAPSSSTVTALQPAGMTTLPGTEEAAASGYPGYPGMPGGMAARAVGVGAPPRYGVKLTVMPRPPAAG
ncbi:PPE family protein [Mycobacterium sp. Lab-001]|uniref:PPE family protein n=1 Tax=Mycobacterium sp. Lab-001 TaxID=3410136 RepID=UPI003D1798E2